MLWLAVYNLTSLSLERCRVLKGRTVILFPDLSKEGTAFQLWSEKAKALEKQLPGIRFIICDILEQKAVALAKTKGYNLADYLIQFDHHTFRNNIPNQSSFAKAFDSVFPAANLSKDQYQVPLAGEAKMNKQDFFPIVPSGENQVSKVLLRDIDSLESFFATTSLPPPPIRLNQCSVMHDLPKFISGHFTILHTYNGNPVFNHYLNRLQLLKQILES